MLGYLPSECRELQGHSPSSVLCLLSPTYFSSGVMLPSDGFLYDVPMASRAAFLLAVMLGAEDDVVSPNACNQFLPQRRGDFLTECCEEA